MTKHEADLRRAKANRKAAAIAANQYSFVGEPQFTGHNHQPVPAGMEVVLFVVDSKGETLVVGRSERIRRCIKTKAGGARRYLAGKAGKARKRIHTTRVIIGMAIRSVPVLVPMAAQGIMSRIRKAKDSVMAGLAKLNPFHRKNKTVSTTAAVVPAAS